MQGEGASEAGSSASGSSPVAPGDLTGLVDRRVDVAICAAILAYAIAILVTSGGLRQGSIPDPIGPGGWPQLLAGILAVVAIALIVRRLVSWNQAIGHLVPGDGSKDDAPNIPSSGLRPFFLLAVGAGWIVSLPTAGFLITTFVATVASIALMRVRAWTKVLLFPFVFTAATWLLFGQVFGIRFPSGPLERALLDIVPHLR